MIWMTLPIFLILLFLGIPMAYDLGLVVWLYLIQTDIPSTLIAVRMTGMLTSFSLVAVPLFICAASIMTAGGMIRRIVDWCMCLVGWIPGGLAQINILLSVIFAGVSGSAMADVASEGQWIIPTMKERGYPVDYACAVTVASSVLSPIIPPSVILIVGGIIGDESIVSLFMAGIVPGLIMALLMMVLAYFLAIRYNHPKETGIFSLKMFLSKTRAAALDLFMPIFVFGGMALGWYTPTEGAAVAVAYAIFIGGVVHRELNWKKLFPIIVESVVITGAVLLMVGLASSYSYIITLTHIPKMVATFVSELSAPSWILVLIVFGILIAVGMVMDGLTAFIIFLPVLLPLGNLLHMPNPIQLILFVAITIVLGVMTPPVGVCLFLASAIAKIDIFRIFRATFPFLVILMFVTILVGFIPFITTWLPSITVK